MDVLYRRLGKVRYVGRYGDYMKINPQNHTGLLSRNLSLGRNQLANEESMCQKETLSRVGERHEQSPST